MCDRPERRSDVGGVSRHVMIESLAFAKCHTLGYAGSNPARHLLHNNPATAGRG